MDASKDSNVDLSSTGATSEPASTPEFTVIVPTSGRRTLRRTLRSVVRAAGDDVEVIVVSDGDQPSANAIAQELSRRWPGIRFVRGPASGRWGNAQRTEGMKHARGAYLLFMDDDDVYRPDAFRYIRQAIERDPGRVIIFRMKRYDSVLWRRPQLEEGEVSTLQFLVPNLPGKVGSWMTNERYESDFDFISETVALQGLPVWDDHVIATIQPLDWRRPAPWVRIRWNHLRAKVALRTRLRAMLRG